VAKPKVRCDYDALNVIAQAFGRQADLSRRTLDQLKSTMDVLQGGDWEGQAALRFYQEMQDQVLPVVQRLAQALVEGSRSTMLVLTAVGFFLRSTLVFLSFICPFTALF
jgi:WXG100 family type VII secretion target